MTIDLRTLKPGTRYQLTFADCCVSGEVRGRFLRDESDQHSCRFVFDFGTLEMYSRTIEEIIELPENESKST